MPNDPGLVERRQNRLSDELTIQILESIKQDLHDVKSDVASHKEVLADTVLSNQERTLFVDMLIKREEKKNKVRDAIIEKTLSGLAWMTVVALGTAFITGVRTILGK